VRGTALASRRRGPQLVHGGDVEALASPDVQVDGGAARARWRRRGAGLARRRSPQLVHGGDVEPADVEVLASRSPAQLLRGAPASVFSNTPSATMV
jgi:ribosomal protein L4